MNDVLCCPSDESTLALDAKGERLICEACSRSYPISNGVARFVPGDSYVNSFSFEWKAHPKTQLDDEVRRESERTFRQKTGWQPDDLTGKRVLDVGCGTGRFADVALRWGAEVYAMDLSFGVDVAFANLGTRPGFHAIQASVFDLPFLPESFDAVYSIGVLDHTPDCERALKALPPLLRPGGQLAVWVYSAHTYRPDSIDEKRDSIYRRYSSRMSTANLYRLCRVLCRVPVTRRGFWHLLLPGFLFHAFPRLNWANDDYDERVLDTFDWYSPVFQSKHSYAEVFRWFREGGLVDVEPLDPEVAVRGRKPARVPAA